MYPTVVAELHEMEMQKELNQERENLKSLIEQEVVLRRIRRGFFFKSFYGSAPSCCGDREVGGGPCGEHWVCYPGDAAAAAPTAAVIYSFLDRRGGTSSSRSHTC